MIIELEETLPNGFTDVASCCNNNKYLKVGESSAGFDLGKQKTGFGSGEIEKGSLIHILRLLYHRF